MRLPPATKNTCKVAECHIVSSVQSRKSHKLTFLEAAAAALIEVASIKGLNLAMIGITPEWRSVSIVASHVTRLVGYVHLSWSVASLVLTLFWQNEGCVRGLQTIDADSSHGNHIWSCEHSANLITLHTMTPK